MTLIWVHDDAISRDHPVFEEAGEGARAVFVYDADYYRDRGYSLKRLVFIMECVEDAGIEVLEGPFADTLLSLSPDHICVAKTPNPHYRDVMETLRQSTEVKSVAAPAFARVGDGIDLKRFFRYWKKAKKDLLRRDA